MTRQKQAKQAANVLYADRFRGRKKKDRKKARRERVIERERRWLQASGIPRDKNWPLA